MSIIVKYLYLMIIYFTYEHIHGAFKKEICDTKLFEGGQNEEKGKKDSIDSINKFRINNFFRKKFFEKQFLLGGRSKLSIWHVFKLPVHFFLMSLNHSINDKEYDEMIF